MFKKLSIALPLVIIISLGLPSQTAEAANAYPNTENKELVQGIEPVTSTIFSGNTTVSGLNTNSFSPLRFGYTATCTEGNGGQQRNYTSITIRTNASGVQSTSRTNSFTSSAGSQRTVRGNSNTQNHRISFRTGMRQDANWLWVLGIATSINGRVDF